MMRFQGSSYNMKRLFYFTGYRLSVSHWKGKELTGTSSFEPTELGLDSFRAYLQQTENIPGNFLVDVIEEDFRNEKVPHVGSKDRKSVISRLIDRYYRSSQNYCYSEIIGRDKSGRKDDTVVIGAMTNPQLIQPWLSIIDECEVPLSGIWTLPLISKHLLKTLKATNGVVLLVSQQVNSNVRQTLFREGKLISSRQSIINQDQEDISGVGELAAPEVARTIQFLRAQNLIGENEEIKLHVLAAQEQVASLEHSFQSSGQELGQQSITIHQLKNIHDLLGLKGVGEKFSDGVFSWCCLNQNFLTSHYGEAQLFNRYHNKLAAAVLYATSLIVIITAVLYAGSNVSDAMEYEKSIAILKKEETSYKDLYAKKFKDFEGVFQNAGVMNSAVELAEQIRINSATSPLDFLIVLSEILSQQGIGTVHIDKIEWKAINIDEQSRAIVRANYTGREPVKHDAVISGRIDEPEHNYRESVNHIQRIIEYLKASPRIENVEALSMPVDVRSKSRFATESGVKSQQQRSSETTGLFSLRIIMKEPGNV